MASRGRRNNNSGGIRKRGESWELRVSAGADSTGRRRIISRSIKGTRREAELALAALVLEHGRGYEQGATSSVGDTVAQSIKLSRLSPTTLAEYKRAAERIPDDLAKMPVWKVRPIDLERAYTELARNGHKQHAIRRVHEVLSSAFGRAVRWGWLDRNPAGPARPPARPKSRIQAATPEQVKQLIAVAPPPLDLWLRLAFVTGMRRGEICGLQWTDVQPGLLVVRRNVVYTPASGVTVKPTKTESERVIALDGVTLGLLLDAISLQALVFDTNWIFTHDGINPWRPDYAGSAIRRLQLTTGVRFRIHSMRHAAASELLDAGFPISTVSERLGHDRESTTMNIYSHSMPARDREAAEYLAGRLD